MNIGVTGMENPGILEAKYLDQGDTTRAVLEFRNAAQVAKSDAEVQYQLGTAYLKAQDIPSAVASFRRGSHWTLNIPGHNFASRN